MKNKKTRAPKTTPPSLPRSSPEDRSDTGVSIGVTIGSNEYVGLIILLVLVFVAFSRNLAGGFVIDDIPLIRDNPFIRNGGASFLEYFTKPFWLLSALQDGGAPMYRPLIHVFNALGYKLWGANSVAYHISLLSLHVTNAGLLYALIRNISPASPKAALWGTAVFALSPVRVESVSWISGIPDPLVLLFILLGLMSHRKAAVSEQPWRYLAALFLFQCALWSKEVAIVFPVIVVAHDFFLSGSRIRWGITSVYMVLTLTHFAVRSHVLGSSSGFEQLAGPPLARTADFFIGYGGLLTIPVHIPFFLATPSVSVASVAGGVGVTLLVALYGFLVKAGNTDERGAVGFSMIWLASFIWPAAVLALYSGGFFTARILYVPAAGLAIALALCLHRLNAAFDRHLGIPAAIAMAVVAAHVAQTWIEQKPWQDNSLIYAKMTQDDPRAVEGYAALGYIYLERGNSVEAEKAFSAVLERCPSETYLSSALTGLGTLKGMAGNIAESRQLLERAISVKPRNSEAWTGLGNLAWMEGRRDEAAAAYRKALEIRPSNQEAGANLETVRRQSAGSR